MDLLSMKLYIGTYLRIPVYLHLTWFLVILMYGLFNGIGTALIMLALFAIILLHEFGHCIAARRLGYGVEDIILLPFGGVARINPFPRTPGHEIIVALAGPFVNVLLIPVLYLPYYFTGSNTLFIINLVNLAILIFNLFPMFPLDGGRVFRSVLNYFTNRYNATWFAGRTGQVLAIALIVFAVSRFDIVGVIMGIFLIMAAQKEIEFEQMRHGFEKDVTSWDEITQIQTRINRQR